MQLPSYVRTRTRKWGRVVDFAINPCDTTLAVYFETLPEAAGKAVLTLLSFGADDVYRGAFRPRGVYPAKHLGRRRRGAKIHGIPELGEEIGKRIIGANELKGRQFGTAEKRLWLFDGFTQRILFWLMVADVTTDFFADWVTGIYRSGFCLKAGTSQFLVEGFTVNTLNPFGQGWEVSNPGNVRYAHHCFYLPLGPWATSLEFPGHGRAFAEWTVRCDPGPDAVFDLRIGSNFPERVIYQPVVVPQNTTAKFTLQMSYQGGYVWTFPGDLNPGARVVATLNAFTVMGSNVG